MPPRYYNAFGGGIKRRGEWTKAPDYAIFLLFVLAAVWCRGDNDGAQAEASCMPTVRGGTAEREAEMTVRIECIGLVFGIAFMLAATGCATPPALDSDVVTPLPTTIEDVAEAERDPPGEPPRVEAPDPMAVAKQPATIEDASGLLAHAGRDATVSASSMQQLHEGEGPVDALLDGDLSTRWASVYAEPQSIVVTLPEPRALASIRLHWEAASAMVYTVSVSVDGETWTPVATERREEPGPRVDTLDLDGSEVLALQFELQQRTNPEWGFSLYQIELLAQ